MNLPNEIVFENQRDEEFERHIVEALDLLPENFLKQLNNVSIVVEDKQRTMTNSFLLGLYHGIPQPLKGPYYSFVLPDKITLYKENIENVSRERDIPLKQIIAEVLFHEIGHYFGLSESELDLFRTF